MVNLSLSLTEFGRCQVNGTFNYCEVE